MIKEQKAKKWKRLLTISGCNFFYLIPPAGLKPTRYPVLSQYSLIALHITRPTARVAFTLSFPKIFKVKVLFKKVSEGFTDLKPLLYFTCTGLDEIRASHHTNK